MEKQQVLYIHGGEAFSDYQVFLEHLQTQPLDDPFRERVLLWSHSLREDLGEEYEVYTPSMPNKQNAKYEEWKIWFERHLEFLRDDVILIGWSQGGYFFAKYLSENTLPISIKALFLVAAPVEPVDYHGEDGGDFAFDQSLLSNLGKQTDNIFIFHSTDDPVVPFSHAETYKEHVPHSTLIPQEGKGHFVISEFPELLNTIRKVTKG